MDDVAEELKLGPNGALIFCMQCVYISLPAATTRSRSRFPALLPATGDDVFVVVFVRSRYLAEHLDWLKAKLDEFARDDV